MKRHTKLLAALLAMLSLPMLTARATWPSDFVSQGAAPSANVMGMETSSLSTALGKQLTGAGVSWLRRNALLWSAVEPAEGQRNWAAVAALENDLRTASQQRLNVILIVRGAPDWAQAVGKACGPVRDDKLAALGTFMRDVVARYSKAPFNVLYYEFGNEPDVNAASMPSDNPFGCWGNPADAYFGGGTFANALKAVYPQLKAANRKAQLLIGGLLLDCDPATPPAGKDCRDSRFLEGILQAGGGAYFDIVSFHAYDFYGWTEGAYENPNWKANSKTTGPVILRKAQFLRDVMKAAGVNKPLLATEIALVCWDCTTTPPEFERTKVNYMPQAIAASKAAGVIGVVWYSWEGWFGTGILNIAGQLNPAYKAYQVAANNLGKATFARERTDIAGARAYEFTRGGKRLTVIWPANGVPTDVTLPAAPARITNAMGEVQKVSTTLSLTGTLYLEWK